MFDKIVFIVVLLLLCSCSSSNHFTRTHDYIKQEINVVKYNSRFTLDRYKQYYVEYVKFDKLNEYDNLCKKDCKKFDNKMNLLIYSKEFTFVTNLYLYDNKNYRQTIFHDEYLLIKSINNKKYKVFVGDFVKMPQAMKLLNEECMSEQKFVNEDVQGVKHMYIVGPMLQAEARNRNRTCISETYH